MYKKKLFISLLVLLCLSSFENIYAQTEEQKKASKIILETFCQKHYSSCFSGRSYVENTLTVEKIEQTSLNQIKVSGYHTYTGRFGARYTLKDYYAYIKFNSNDTFEIKFYKRSMADLLNPEDYWEDCTKTLYP